MNNIPKPIKYHKKTYYCVDRKQYELRAQCFENGVTVSKNIIAYHNVYCLNALNELNKETIKIVNWLVETEIESLRIPSSHHYLIDKNNEINIIYVDDEISMAKDYSSLNGYKLSPFNCFDYTICADFCYNSKSINDELPSFIKFNIAECGVRVMNTTWYWRRSNSLEEYERKFIKTLKGLPQIIKGLEFDKDDNIYKTEHDYLRDPRLCCSFSCCKCNLLSLEGGPKYVRGHYDVTANKLTSLKGGPVRVGRFIAGRNMISSLKNGPKYVEEDYIIIKNLISSMEGAPYYVGGKFNLNTNKLTDKEIDSTIEKLNKLKTQCCWNNFSVMWNPDLIKYRNKNIFKC